VTGATIVERSHDNSFLLAGFLPPAAAAGADFCELARLRTAGAAVAVMLDLSN
jgi:hypothetical protein